MLVIKAAAPARLREINAASARRVGCVFRPESRSRPCSTLVSIRGPSAAIPRRSGPSLRGPDA
jgi:hypothetical protein